MMPTNADRPVTGMTTPARTSRLLDPSTILSVLIAALLALCVWTAANQPVSPPDFVGKISGLAFSPFQRGQSPEAGSYPSKAELRADLVRAARVAGQIRTYSVQGVQAEIPVLAEDLRLKVTLGAWLGH